MQFSIFTILTLVTAAMAGPSKLTAETSAHTWLTQLHLVNKRQETDTEVSNAVMTDADGNIVPFDSNGVVQVNKAAGI